MRTYLPTQPLKNMVELSLRVRLGPYDMAWGSNYAPLRGNSAVFVHDALFQSNHEWFTAIERIYFSPIMIAACASSVLVGPANGKADQLEHRVLAANDDGSIRYTGYVETEQLAWLYRNTALFVYLSLDEGYGLPPLEALRLGAPVSEWRLPSSLR